MSSTPFSPLQVAGGRRVKPKINIPGVLCFPIQGGVEDASEPRGRRNRALSPPTKLRVARIRKKCACFRCQILKLPCDEERPCKKCKAVASRLNSWAGLKWMDCIVLSIADWSIYNPDASLVLTQRQSYSKTLSSLLDEAQLPLEPDLQVTIDFLAKDIAAWITVPDPTIAASKLELLCISELQKAAEGVVKDFPINDFRLLLWTTTLVHTTRCHNSEEHQGKLGSTCNLDKFRDWCGHNVVNELDRLCRPHSIQRLTTPQRKLLFLLVTGVCLCATYTSDVLSRSTACLTEQESDLKPDPKRLTFFIRVLAHVRTYLGHLTNLLDPDIDSRTVLDDMGRYWDNKGNYSRLFPCSLVEKLQAELCGDILDRQINSEFISQSNSEDRGDIHAVEGLSATLRTDHSPVAGFANPQTQVLKLEMENRKICPACDEEFDGELCIWCEFKTLPWANEIEARLTNNTTPLDLMPLDLMEVGFLGSQHTRNNHAKPENPPPRYISSHRAPINCWYCCHCNDGPKLYSNELLCVSCDHTICTFCDTGL